MKPSKQDQRVLNQFLTVKGCQHAEIHRNVYAVWCCWYIQDSGGDLPLYDLIRVALHSGLAKSRTASQCCDPIEHCMSQECCV